MIGGDGLMDDDYVGNFLYSILGDDAIESDQLGNLFVVSRLGTYYTTAAGTNEDWLLRQQANADGITAVQFNSDRDGASLPQPDIAYSTGLDATAAPVQTSNNSSAAWYDRTWRELKVANPGWSDQQVTNEMTQQINLADWNYNYKKLISDIANSSSAAEREQKISDHKSELDAYRDSDINVDNDLKYLRNTQGEAAGQDEMLNQDLNFSLADAKPSGDSPDLIHILAERLQYNVGTNSSSSVSAEYMVSPDSNVYGESPVTEEEIKAGIHLNEAGIKVNSEGIPLPEEIDKINVRERVATQRFYESGVASIGEFFKNFGDTFKDSDDLFGTKYMLPLAAQTIMNSEVAMTGLKNIAGRGSSKAAKGIEAAVEETGTAKRLGGAYKNLSADGGQVHHMPADSASPISKGNGPAIRMETKDHMRTESWGNYKSAQEYRANQENLIKEGKIREAQQLDIDDIVSKFGNKYDEAIKQMQEYTEKLLQEMKK